MTGLHPELATSKRIAAIVGPTAIVVGLSEWVNLRRLTADVGPNLVNIVYLNGALLFVAGLSLVRDHNYWPTSWPVLITLTAWGLLLFGLLRMFAPATGEPARHVGVYGLLIVIIAMGIVLTSRGYSREATPERRSS